MTRIIFLIAIVSLIALPLMASATDGDVTYSAPYIWVNPETGQIEMKNPGPQPKAHPGMSTESAETPAQMVMAAEEGDAGAGDHASGAEGEAVAHTNPIHPIIVLAGMIATVSVIVVMGRKS